MSVRYLLNFQQSVSSSCDIASIGLEPTQIREDDYFGHVLVDDLKAIPRDIRGKHRTDTSTADTPSIA